ncbi:MULTISPECIES: BTAD domain-containing putative transcriptional regulator [unclassified Streptomyces]|uniref:BTAD domain-containing putative transcriptional regulator n=1 Tax=unclassified Streptomyces TaxID=2593676 RepID=UPI002E2FE731|nr:MULTISPECIES: BTAD domain-containing putative transcriptional regulator [unclassified Streptomyces]
MRYRILGVAQAEDERGTPTTVGGPRVRALLTALARRPDRTTSPETLIDEVWADDPPLDAPAALQALVGRLRRALGRDAVVSEPGGYRLRATSDDIDLFVFERLVREGTAALGHGDAPTAARSLREALALWRGPALADLPDRGAATRVEALRLEATRTRIEADLRLGRAPDLVPELRELTADHPYDEALRALLLRALRDAGRGADALAAYEEVRRALLDGLGTDPGPELRSLHAELLGRESGPTPIPVRPGRNSNIRPRLNSFVGRETDLEAIRSDLRGARLVTLTGPGGSGKTRLAEEAATGLPQAWLVELAPLDRPEAVPGAVVSALGLRETALMSNETVTGQDDPVALLVEYCAARPLLLVLDNCEHVIGAAADLAETLLTHCPGLTILATSREPLGVPGESVRPVEPLPPDPARRLFTQRAAAVRPGADVALGDPDAVDEICRRLDGLPLAIELAAARLRLLTPRQIADRLDDRFRLLTSGSRTVLPRQQTLRAVVDWSWDLLDEAERTVLREASVFAGGWDLAAAEAVCTGPAAHLVGALVDKSLVVATPYDPDDDRSGAAGTRGGGGMRYRMLETIHEYAAERAAEVPDLRAEAERRHRVWARGLAERAEPLLRSAAQLPWIRRLETELDNIRAALHRALVAGAEEEAGSLVLAMGWFWWLRNFRDEGTDWTDRVLRLGAALDATGSAPGAHGGAGLAGLERFDPLDAFLDAPGREESHPLHRLRMRVRMLHLFMRVETEQLGEETNPRLREYVERVRDAFEKGGPDAASMPGIVWPMAAFFLSGSYDVRPAMEKAVANCRAYGDDWAIGVTLMFRTHMVVDAPGGMPGVDDDLAELRVLSRRVGDRWMRAQVCSAAAEAAMARGLFDEAKAEYEEALRLAFEVGANAETPFLLARLAELAYRSGERAQTLAALDEADAAADRYGVTDSRAFVRLLRAQLALDDDETALARDMWSKAHEMSLRGTPPPQFMAALNWVEALITAAESGPERGLRKMAAALDAAVAGRCADTVTASLVESAAGLLSGLGDHARATRLLTAGERWRGGHPRLALERAAAERGEAAARAVLGSGRYASERGRGAGFTADDALRDLADAVREHPAREPSVGSR